MGAQSVPFLLRYFCDILKKIKSGEKNMIKLIATDLDGSLLNDEKQVPTDLDQVLAGLKEKGIAFAAVTGRNFDATCPALGNNVLDMICVCNNGANIYEKGEMIISHALTKDQIHRTLDLLKGMENVTPLLFTLDSSCCAPGCPGFMEWAKAPYSPIKWVDSYDDLYNIDEEIFKISVYDGSGDITNYSYPPLAKEFAGQAAVYVSGDIWVDVVNINASKGHGLKLIQEKLGIAKEETMAFGDYYNDDSLLAQAGYPFVMEGGVDRLKAKYPYRAGSNNAGGVTQAIKEYVLEGIKKL